MRTRGALVAIAATAGLLLTGCSDPQEVCDGVDLEEEAKDAATAATGHGFEVELEVEDDVAGTAECVWDNSRRQLIGSTDSE